MKKIIITTILSLSFSFAALAQDGGSLGLNEIEQNYLLEKNKEYSITQEKLFDYLNQYTQWFDRTLPLCEKSKQEKYVSKVEKAISKVEQIKNNVRDIKIIESKDIFVFYLPSGELRISSALMEMTLSDDELFALLASSITTSEYGNIFEVLNLGLVYALDNNDSEAVKESRYSAEKTSLEEVELRQINEYVLSARYTSKICENADDRVYDIIKEAGMSPNIFISLLDRVSKMQQQDLDMLQYRQLFSLFHNAENRAIRLQSRFAGEHQ